MRSRKILETEARNRCDTVSARGGEPSERRLGAEPKHSVRRRQPLWPRIKPGPARHGGGGTARRQFGRGEASRA